MSAAELPRGPLRIEANPFMPGTVSPRIGRPLQRALNEVLHQVAVKTPLVLVTGGAGTGKTLLSNVTARACSEMGLSVRSVDRGDMIHVALGERSDLLLVDEADSVEDSAVEALSTEGGNGASTTTVFLGLPACASRLLSLGIRPVLVELTALPPAEARTYLLETARSAGLPDLFTPEALDLIVHGSQGAPRLLLSMASFAFFVSASDDASQISTRHVGQAGTAQVPLGSRKTGQSNEHMFLGFETPVENLKNGHPPLIAEGGAERTYPLTSDVEGPVEDREVDFGAQEIDERTEQVLRNKETPVEGQKNAHLPLDGESVDEAPRGFFPDEEAHVPFRVEKAGENSPLIRDGGSLVEDQSDAGRLQSQLSSSRSPPKRRKTRGNAIDDSRLSSATLLAIAAFLFLESFAFVSILPSLLTRPSPDSAAEVILPAPVQALLAEQVDLVVPALVAPPALPPPVSREAKAGTETAPVSNETQRIAPAETKAASRGPAEVRVPSAMGGRVTRSTLTEEEKAAVARGMQELEREAAQAKR